MDDFQFHILRKMKERPDRIHGESERKEEKRKRDPERGRRHIVFPLDRDPSDQRIARVMTRCRAAFSIRRKSVRLFAFDP